MPAHANLAAKYRPSVLKQLVGQETVVEILQGMLESGKISRSLLVAGPYGSGKTTVARLIARYLNCLGERENMAESPCGNCEACTRMDRGSLLDYMEINAADSRGIDDIRRLIDQVAYKPQTKYRVVVLDEVHRLTPQAFDALLKIVEEPPSATVFVLCTTDPGKMPPALRSRCKKLQIEKVPPEKTVKVLRRAVRGEGLSEDQFTEQVLLHIATAVDGHPRDAIMTLEAFIDRVTSKGGVDKIPIEELSAMVLNIADEVAGESPDALVGNFLLGIYKGAYTRPFLALRDVSKYDTFVELLLQYHKQTIFYYASVKLHDKMYVDWYATLAKEVGDMKDLTKKPSPVVLGALLTIFVEVAQKIKNYTFDGDYLLMDAAVRGVAVVKQNTAPAAA